LPRQIVESSQNTSPRSPAGRLTSVDFRGVLERAPAIIYRHGVLPDHRVEYVNPAVTETLGYSPDDFYANPDLARILLDQAKLTDIEQADPEKPGRPTIRRWRRRDGTYADVEERSVAIRDRHGRVAAIEGVARDVTDELAIERELRNSRARLDAVVAHVPIILWATDTQGRLTFLEGAGLRSLGIKPEELVGRTPAEIHPDAPRYRRYLLLAIRGHVQSVDVRLGDMTFRTIVGPLVDADGTIVGVTGVSTDITPQCRQQEALASETHDRASVGAALARLEPGSGLDDLVREISTEVAMLDGVDTAGIIAFGPGSLTYFMFHSGNGLPIQPGRALPPTRSAYLRERAEQGPWAERWVPRAADGNYGLALKAAGLTAAAYVPLRLGDATLGLLSVSSRKHDGLELLERRMSVLRDFGALTAAMIGPALASRQTVNVVRDELLEVIRQEAFTSVYQPIVGLTDRSPVAFEALTRFHDGSPPDRRFLEAESVDMGVRLEAATLESALRGLGGIPAGTAMTLNVSPAMILEGRILKRLLGPIRQAITLEVTEHRRIENYELLRQALRGLPATVGLAIDDAGAGFASLRHVIELRPDYVKLDRGLVAGVDGDTARRAVVAGMAEFARGAGYRLIAEGVETEAEHETLLELGVEFAQGYLYAAPAPLGTARRGVRRQTRPG
jgi:PAS domain S-box-containing protein